MAELGIKFSLLHVIPLHYRPLWPLLSKRITPLMYLPAFHRCVDEWNVWSDSPHLVEIHSCQDIEWFISSLGNAGFLIVSQNLAPVQIIFLQYSYMIFLSFFWCYSILTRARPMSRLRPRYRLLPSNQISSTPLFPSLTLVLTAASSQRVMTLFF